MPADSRTGIESRIVLRPVCEVKTTGRVTACLIYCAGGAAESVDDARFVSVT